MDGQDEEDDSIVTATVQAITITSTTNKVQACEGRGKAWLGGQDEEEDRIVAATVRAITITSATNKV